MTDLDGLLYFGLYVVSALVVCYLVARWFG